MSKKRMKDERGKRKEDADAWNHWKPGSGRKGWSPFDKPIPPVRDGETGHPIRNGQVDWGRVIRESNEKHGG